jgi:hypothetical protein
MTGKNSIVRKPQTLKNVSDLKPYLIIWNDAYIQLEFDGPLNSVPNDKYIQNETLAFIVSQTKYVVKACFEICRENNSVRYLYTIPKKYIEKIIPLGVIESVGSAPAPESSLGERNV